MLYRKTSYPPAGELDHRLINIACTNLQPVEKIHENKYFTVYNRGGYYTIENNLPQVAILPVVDNQYFVMVRVKRPVLDDVTLELPAGALDEGEVVTKGAARELAEETGIIVEDLKRFIPMPPLAASPNRNPKLIYIFQIHLSMKEFNLRQPHDNEVESVECVKVNNVIKMITNGGIYVTGSIAVIGSYLLSQGFGKDRL